MGEYAYEVLLVYSRNIKGREGACSNSAKGAQESGS